MPPLQASRKVCAGPRGVGDAAPYNCNFFSNFRLTGGHIPKKCLNINVDSNNIFRILHTLHQTYTISEKTLI